MSQQYPQYNQGQQPPYQQQGQQPAFNQQQPAYGQQQPQYNQYGAGAPPQNQQPPYNQQYPQPGHQQQYGQPQQGGYQQPPPAQNQGYGAPAGQYGQPPPPQGHYGQPPQGQYGGGGYGAPPPPQQGYNQGSPPPGPQQGQWGALPPQQYNQPPPPQQFNQPPPVQQMSTTYLGAPVHPSENPFIPKGQAPRPGQVVDQYDQVSMARDVDLIKKATKGFGTDEKMLTNLFVPMTALRFPPLAEAYKVKHHQTLEALMTKELGGNYREFILGLLRGPIHGDVHYLEKATKGLGTNEALLTDLVIGRTPTSISFLRESYNLLTHKRFDVTILDELSFKTKDAFHIALQGEWKDQFNNGKGLPESGGVGGAGGFAMGGAQQGLQVNEQMVQQDLNEISKVLHPLGTSTDTTLLASIFFARSPAHLHRLQQLYLQTRKAPLTRHVKSNVSGHLRNALLYALEGGKKDTTGCWRDAKMLHATMEGIGTKDVLLIIRLLRAHWDRPRFAMIKQAYQAKYHTSLDSRVMKETSGDYRDALMALCNQPAF